MRTTTFVIAGLAAFASASVVRQERQTVPVLGGPDVPDADRVCTKSGEKCAGIPGEDAVVFSPCCDERLACGVPTAVVDGVWGQFCIAEEDVDVAATQLASDGAGIDIMTIAPTETVATLDDGEVEMEEDGEEESDTNPTVVVASDESLDAEGENDEEDVAPGATEEAEDSTTPVLGTTVGDDDSSEDDSTSSATDEEDAVADASEEENDATATDEDDDSEGDIITARATDDDDDGSVCFPASATVELQNGDVVSMDSVSIGDMVKVGVDEYSRVFMFTHKMADEAHTFVSLETESGAALSLTSGHYLFVNGALAAAKTVSVGDMLTLGNGETSPVTAVSAKAGTGLFNPQTLNGNVVVDGVLSSTYTTAVEPALAHALLAPFRVLNGFGLSFTAMESGGGVFADLAPNGQAVL